MKKISNALVFLFLMSQAVFSAGDNLGEYMTNHTADNREYWQILPFKAAKIPLDYEWMIGGINFFPSLHTMMLFLAILVITPLAIASKKRKNRF